MLDSRGCLCPPNDSASCFSVVSDRSSDLTDRVLSWQGRLPRARLASPAIQVERSAQFGPPAHSQDRSKRVTLGLPRPRTNPDDGVACNLAGKGVARPDSVRTALMLAARLSANRG